MTRTADRVAAELRIVDLQIAAWAGTRRATVKRLRVVRARLAAELAATWEIGAAAPPTTCAACDRPNRWYARWCASCGADLPECDDAA